MEQSKFAKYTVKDAVCQFIEGATIVEDNDKLEVVKDGKNVTIETTWPVATGYPIKYKLNGQIFVLPYDVGVYAKELLEAGE